MPRLASEVTGSRSVTPANVVDDIPASIPQTQTNVDDAAEEQLEQELEDTTQKKQVKKGKQTQKKRAEKPAEPEVSGDEEEEIYEVESIVNHTFKGKKCLYQVRWKGYAEADDTWEPEEHLVPESATILAIYHKKIGGAPQPPKKIHKVASKAQLKADSHDEDTNNTDSPAAKRQKRSHRQMNETLSPGTPAWQSQSIGSWMPNDKTSWEDLVHEVETVERDGEGNLHAFIRFKNGKRSKIAKNLYTSRCPRALVKFYESHLNFASSEQIMDDKPNGDDDIDDIDDDENRLPIRPST